MSQKKPQSVNDFRALIRDTEIRCLMQNCSFQGHSLVAHLRDKHQMSPGQYQKKFPRKEHPEVTLVSRVVTEALRRMERSVKRTTDLGNFTTLFDVGVSPSELFVDVEGKLPAIDENYRQYASPARVDEFFEFPADQTRAILTGMIMRKNTYISGPTGCGKTELAIQIHKQLKDRPFMRINMKGDATVANFIGAMRADKKRGTYFKYGALPIAMKAGYTLIVDEVDYTPPQIAATLNPVLEGSRNLYLEDNGETIHAADGFCVIATGNTAGKSDPTGVYTGTEVLNTAFLDRFGIKLTLDYLDSEIEIAMLMRRFPFEKRSEVVTLCKVAKEIREAFKQGSLSITLSTRKLIDYLELRPTMGHLESLRAVLINWLDEDDKELVLGLIERCGMETK